MIRTIVKIQDYNGKLTINWGKTQNWSLPQIETDLTVFNVKSSDYPHLLGKEFMCQVDGDNVVLFVDGRHLFIDATSEKVQLIEPLKKPRKSKNYDWEYSMGQWVKKWTSFNIKF